MSNAPYNMANFVKLELTRALSEISYGISAFRVDEDVPSSCTAVAVVDLLEGNQIRISLSNRGFQHDNGPVFEMLEGLLSSVSPLFQNRQATELINRLSHLESNLS